MTDEWLALMLNKTFIYVDKLPNGAKAITSRWVYKTKTLANGDLNYKARLVVRGFEQQYGVDYTETFAPVAKLSTIRALLTMAASLSWAVHQMDVVTAFLNPTLSEDVYMELPQGHDWLPYLPENSGRYIKLYKALYGLKQAPRE